MAKGDLFGISVDEKLACIRRELSLRRHVYPRRIAEQKMSQRLADREISTMEAIEKDYEEKLKNG